MEQVKSALERMHSISYMATATKVGISPVKCLLYPYQELWEIKVSAKWIPHKLNDDQTAKCVLASAHLQQWRYEAKMFLDHILMVDVSWTHLFDPQL
jgi:hypothetical protein